MDFDIANAELVDRGRLRVEWAETQMPVLRQIRERFSVERPLAGQRIAACLHVTTETANLMSTLVALSTQDDVAAWLVEDLGIGTFAVHGEDRDRYYRHIHAVLDFAPTITIDDGADVISTLHSERQDLIPGIVAGMEETTTGVIRLRAMAADGALKYPLIAVNDANTKRLFDNYYGTGQSTIDGILRATNILLAGRNVVVCGYGQCGRGVATRAHGMGASVIVCEVDPLQALQAALDGYRVMPISDAAAVGHVFVTVTGDCGVIRGEHFDRMQDGAILCNSGHFDVEIDLVALSEMATSRRRIRHETDEYLMPDGRRIYILGEGRLVNLASAEGHPASVMDMSFANQALCSEYVAKNKLSVDVHTVPAEIDAEVARLKLASMGVRIDTLTPEQEKYLSSWQSGT